MLIIPLPWSRRDLEDLRDRSSVFDLLIKESTQQHYLIVQDNTITWVGQGAVPGKAALYVRARVATMNGKQGYPDGCVFKDLGNVGFLGKFSGIDDAILKVFPKTGYCISNMKFMQYTGQRLKGAKYHYEVIEPILCLLSDQPSIRLQHFFQILGWGGRKKFTCDGIWEKDMRLFIGDSRASTLEVWFGNFAAIALGAG